MFPNPLFGSSPRRGPGASMFPRKIMNIRVHSPAFPGTCKPNTSSQVRPVPKTTFPHENNQRWPTFSDASFTGGLTIRSLVNQSLNLPPSSSHTHDGLHCYTYLSRCGAHLAIEGLYVALSSTAGHQQQQQHSH